MINLVQITPKNIRPNHRVAHNTAISQCFVELVTSANDN